jgi:hypothetical protein
MLAALLFLSAALNLSAQGTAISYQGRLSDSGELANTNYDFRFAVFSAPTNGTMISLWLTNSAVPVSNGLFNVILNFGPGVFNGPANGSNDWLDISVRAIGATSFTELTPRQPILPVPYAIFATSASNLLGTLQATQLVGTIASSVISGTYSNGVNFVNGTNSFAGNGASLTNLNASNLASGTVADARLAADVALLDQNQTYTGTNTFNSPVTFNKGDTFNASNTFTGPNSFSGANSFSGVNTFTNNGNSFFGNFFGNGLVGWIPVYGNATNAMRDAGYLLLNSGFTTVLLPATASLSNGDIIRVSGGGAGGWRVVANSGQSIIGNFTSYSNCLPALKTGGSYSDVAASADGVHMFYVGVTFTGVYASSDSGENWSQLTGINPSGYYYSIACSANGRTVYAAPTSGKIMVSTDGGATWSATAAAEAGSAISCSANGSQLFTNNYACSGNGTYLAKVAAGSLSFSTNSGTSWIPINNAPASASCVAASSDCTRLVMGASDGLLYASANQGLTWTALTTTNSYWTGAWMSPDGSKLAASATANGLIDGGIFYSSVSTQPNLISTNVIGSQGSAVELQYIGGGQFVPAGSTGLLWSN